MDHIQGVALDLFEERGFAAVTIEEVAERAEVSARSVYRYFGTKEGLVLRDALDAEFVAMLPPFLAETGSLIPATRAALDHLAAVADGAIMDEALEQSVRRLRIWYDTPAIRVAAFGIADEMAHDIARAMVEAGVSDRTPAQCRVEATAMIFGFFAALEEWYVAGGDANVFEFAVETLDVLFNR